MKVTDLSAPFRDTLSEWGYVTDEEQQNALNAMMAARRPFTFPAKRVSDAMEIDPDVSMNYMDTDVVIAHFIPKSEQVGLNSASALRESSTCIYVVDPRNRVVPLNEDEDESIFHRLYFLPQPLP